MLKDRYKKARKFLGLSQTELAKGADLTHSAIGSVERGNSDLPNHRYTQFLVENGINYFYLIGKSDDISGNGVNLENFAEKSEIQALEAQLEALQKQLLESVPKAQYDELRIKYEGLQETLKLLTQK